MNQGYGGPPDERPYLMPAGMPPGGEYEHEERTPEGVTYFRVCAGIMSALSACLMLLGVLMLFFPLLTPKGGGASSTDAWIAGIFGALFYGGLGVVFFVPWMIALFGGRKPWVHTLGTVMLALSMTSLCCAPILIPLLITWLKPETKRWYGAA